MFADPQSVTIGGVATPLPRIPSDQPIRVGQFQSTDGTVSLSARQDKTNNRFRREIRLTQKKVAADPISAVNKEVSTSIIIAIDEPRWGFSDSEVGILCNSLVAWFTAGNRDKLLGGEL